jgi:hypothetical protein
VRRAHAQHAAAAAAAAAAGGGRHGLHDVEEHLQAAPAPPQQLSRLTVRNPNPPSRSPGASFGASSPTDPRIQEQVRGR